MTNDLKLILQNIMSKNIDIDNFVDNMELARVFECNILKEELINFGKKNF